MVELREPVTSAKQIRRNTVFLSLCLVTLSGVLQLAVAVATITLVLVTGVKSILGLGPAIFLTASALAALPSGRLMDRFGRVPVISDRKSTRLNSSHLGISYAVFCLKKKKHI